MSSVNCVTFQKTAANRSMCLGHIISLTWSSGYVSEAFFRSGLLDRFLGSSTLLHIQHMSHLISLLCVKLYEGGYSIHPYSVLVRSVTAELQSLQTLAVMVKCVVDPVVPKTL